MDGDPLDREQAELLGAGLHLENLRAPMAEAARAIKLATTGDRVTVSRNIFIRVMSKFSINFW